MRVYVPEAAASGLAPGIVYFHGGGFVYCSLETHDGTCCVLASASGCVVMSVDYRLAPEHTYPAEPQDGLAAVGFAAERSGEIGIDPARAAVAGDSAGGNLATVGVKTQLRRYDGMIHGFFSMGDTVDKGRLAVEEVGRALGSQFQPVRRAR